MIDTHAHLHLIHRSNDTIWADAQRHGVKHIIQVAIDDESLALNQSEFSAMPWCSITAGLHPLSVADTPCLDTTFDTIESMIPAIVAIGEIGLDYKYGDTNKDQQQAFFIRQLDLATTYNKPVIIHSRQADDDMLAIINAYPHLKKVVHCYATTIDFFESLAGDQNYVSFTGMVTYSKKGKVIRALKSVPMDRLMIETDAPYLRPKGCANDQNEPMQLLHIAQAVANHRGQSLSDIIAQTTQNAIQFFELSFLENNDLI
jgi:TatD DNase family protein